MSGGTSSSLSVRWQGPNRTARVYVREIEKIEIRRILPIGSSVVGEGNGARVLSEQCMGKKDGVGSIEGGCLYRGFFLPYRTLEGDHGVEVARVWRELSLCEDHVVLVH